MMDTLRDELVGFVWFLALTAVGAAGGFSLLMLLAIGLE